MGKANTKSPAGNVDKLMADKSGVLTKAHALATMGLHETAQPLWVAAAGLEERIASILDANGNLQEAVVHRISAASCYQKAGDPSKATNLFRAALAGPLRDANRKEVEAMLADCLSQLAN
jgi:hypothetical protein